MTQETPAKVFSLLGTAMASMFFLFAVASTNASFTNTEYAFPDTFSPENVVASLDGIANEHAKFVEVNVTGPWQESYAIAQDNVRFVIDNADYAILNITGLTSLASAPEEQPVSARVAGASTRSEYSHYLSISTGFNIDSLYSLLFQ